MKRARREVHLSEPLADDQKDLDELISKTTKYKSLVLEKLKCTSIRVGGGEAVEGNICKGLGIYTVYFCGVWFFFFFSMLLLLLLLCRFFSLFSEYFFILARSLSFRHGYTHFCFTRPQK